MTADRVVREGRCPDGGYCHAIEEAGRQHGVRPFRELFAGGPDTPCRTTWRREPGWSLPGADVPLTECVEVPLDDVRAAFAEAGEEP